MKYICYNLLFILLAFTNCSNSLHPNDSIPEHETFTIKSKQVGEVRTINVWTPEDYKTSKVSLPVMYMADGGLKEDFPHIANTLSELIKQKKINPIILVGIENTQRRRDLTGFTEVAEDKEIAPIVGGSEKFSAFIRDELFTEINKRYRTTSKKGIIGESLAGLFVTETLFSKPEMFDFYIAFDPSLWWNNKYLLKRADKFLDSHQMKDKTIWVGASKEAIPILKELDTTFKTKNNTNIQWHFSEESEEDHSTIFRATKEKAIIWTLDKI